MSKELEALEILKNMALSDLDSIPITAIPICEKFNEETMKNYKNLKRALLKFKQIKEAEPSEALKYVGVLKEEDCITTLVQGKTLETIRQYILKAQEQGKVLKAIKNITKLGDDFNSMLGFDTYEEDCKHSCDYDYELTKKEYKLLKEVIEDE